jgi:hypothetical protein
MCLSILSSEKNGNVTKLLAALEAEADFVDIQR